MPPRTRKPSELTVQLVPLVIFGIGMVTSNPAATILDDEAHTLSQAAQPVHDILTRFFPANAVPYSRPPLFEILLHFWIRSIGGSFAYLRIPSILLFLAGLFLLGRTARMLMGTKGGAAVIWAGVLWPFGFHYGRLAIPSLFSFFLVCGLTFALQKFLEDRNTKRWTVMFLFCLALVWTSYFGWAMVACVAVELALRFRNSGPGVSLTALGGSIAILILSLVPFLGGIRLSLSSALHANPGPRIMAANVAYNTYSLFVSESVAPWYWRFSIPAGVAILACVILAVLCTPRSARRFLIYSAFLIIVMAFFGKLNLNSLLDLSPWILLPIGIAVEAEKPKWRNLGLAAALLIIGGIGWYGIYSRRFYSSPRFVEPWEQVASGAAGKIRTGAYVIADDPSLLVYLTYILQIPNQNGPWTYAGSVTEFEHDPRIFSPSDWLASGRAKAQTMELIRGGDEPVENAPIDQVAKQLDQSCGSISSRLMVRDSGYAWKQRYLGEVPGPLWRIEVREYDCNASNSKEIYPLPPH